LLAGKISLENLPRGGEFKIFSFANCEWLVNVTSYMGVHVGEFSRLTNMRVMGAPVFVDHYLDHIHVNLMKILMLLVP
jgi:hypothetical protein